MMFFVTRKRKWSAVIALTMVLSSCFLFFYEREDPAKWGIGKWVENKHNVTMDVSPDYLQLVSKDERRKYTFTYTIDTWESPYQVSIYRRGDLYGMAIIEFEGKDKLIVKKKPISGEDDLSEAANHYVSIWIRVKE